MGESTVHVVIVDSRPEVVVAVAVNLSRWSFVELIVGRVGGKANKSSE